jgi:hypothetical protein
MAGIDDKWSIEKLDGSNWTTWKFQMKHLLMAKGLWKVVDGTETVPDAADAAVVAKYHQKVERTGYHRLRNFYGKAVFGHLV